MKLGLMTKYLIKKILKRHRDQFAFDSNVIDVESILKAHCQDSYQYSVCIQQLESLAKIYQVYEKQNQNDQKEKIERKIISLLGLTMQEV